MAGREPKYRTRFPVSRIKKIMQADESVGKIAQTTPAVVSRAIELFLEGMVLRAAAEDSTMRITPGALKRMVMAADEYDFLRGLFETVAEEKAAPRSGSAAESDAGTDSAPAKSPGKRTSKGSDARRVRARPSPSTTEDPADSAASSVAPAASEE